MTINPTTEPKPFTPHISANERLQNSLAKRTSNRALNLLEKQKKQHQPIQPEPTKEYVDVEIALIDALALIAKKIDPEILKKELVQPLDYLKAILHSKALSENAIHQNLSKNIWRYVFDNQFRTFRLVVTNKFDILGECLVAVAQNGNNNCFFRYLINHLIETNQLKDIPNFFLKKTLKNLVTLEYVGKLNIFIEALKKSGRYDEKVLDLCMITSCAKTLECQDLFKRLSI